MSLIVEHIAFKHIKIVCIAEEEGLTEIYGDLPGLPSCFDKLSCISLGGIRSCISNWVELDDMKLRFMTSTVLEEDKITGFQIVSKKNLCSHNPEDLVLMVLDALSKLCGYDASNFL